MFIRLQRVILSLVLALWAALATAQGIVAERNPLLYAISSKTTTVYLFGTIHLAHSWRGAGSLLPRGG